MSPAPTASNPRNSGRVTELTTSRATRRQRCSCAAPTVSRETLAAACSMRCPRSCRSRCRSAIPCATWHVHAEPTNTHWRAKACTMDGPCRRWRPQARKQNAANCSPRIEHLRVWVNFSQVSSGADRCAPGLRQELVMAATPGDQFQAHACRRRPSTSLHNASS